MLVNLCLIAQLLTVGLAVLYDSSWWNIHVFLVHGYSGLVVLLLVELFLNPFPGKINILTSSTATLLVLQFIIIHVNHPVPPYASDLTDQQWAILEPLIPAAKASGYPRNVNLRDVINAILYILIVPLAKCPLHEK